MAELAKRELARRHLADFVLYTYPGYLMGWVHRELCDALEWFYAETIAKRSPRLLVTMPPRHGKSELVSRRFPAWVFGRNPDLQIIAASYSSDLAKRMNRDTQRIIDSVLYRNVFPKTSLSGKNIATSAHGAFLRNSEMFEIVNAKGSYRGAGVGNAITGMGCNALLIDDPLKDRRDASSETVRNNVWDWYASTAYTRLSPGGGVMLTQTRWHEDDLAGRLLDAAKNDGDQWRVINFPAIAEENELHRMVGDPLHPDRYPLDALRSIERTIGSYEWSSLYQQHPSADGGNIVKRAWIKYYLQNERPTSFERMLQSWDFTFKNTDGSDYVVGTVWGKSGADYYLLDLVRDRMDFVESIQALRDMSAKWPMATEKIVEDKANGPAIISAIRREISGVIAVTPTDSKDGRLRSTTPLFEAGNVYFPDPSYCLWSGAAVDELVSFPTAKHDDQVDSISQALNRFMKSTATPETFTQINSIFRANQRVFPNR